MGVVDGNGVQTYDVCFHPQTLQYAAQQVKFHDMVVRSAIEGVQKAMGTEKLESSKLLVHDSTYYVLMDSRLSRAPWGRVQVGATRHDVRINSKKANTEYHTRTASKGKKEKDTKS